MGDCMFTLTSGYSDKLFPMGANFSPSSCDDFSVIIAAVNAFIHSVQGDVDIDASSRLYPLFCTGLEYENQCREIESSVLQFEDITDSNNFSDDSFDSRPYYLKASDVYVIGVNNEIQEVQELEGSSCESSEEVTAVIINSIPIEVLGRI
jgi:hypothetical protein